MEIPYPINVNDPRTYILPAANIIGRRLNRIATLNNKLVMMVAKLYLLPDESDKNEICDKISDLIEEIELLVMKNIDDTQVLEYALAEFTMKPITPVESFDDLFKTTDTPPDQHIYA